ncbi:hypothetical protein OAG1_14320 [Agarivorans sp. OAG1]|uniref:DUF7674 family protein n=1 Tax=Agarivorans sp. OAG1 TaxID=3082387 RepID=UPI002B30DB08|nr:hypothetical protein OAG1_14320 [Agarivorans sp. OAG1]
MNNLEVLEYILSLDANFSSVWNSDDNYNREDDGSATICGVLTEFGQYLQDHTQLDSLTYLKEFFEFLEVHSDDNTELGGAIRVCFLEGLAFTPAGKSLEHYMGKRCRHYMSGGTFQWST